MGNTEPQAAKNATGQMESWDEVVASEVGHVFRDSFNDGVRFVILRGPASLCAYVGVPIDHPLAGKSYDDLPLDCHGGLTFGDKGYQSLSDAFYWYGWDYAHCDDRSTYDDNPRFGETDRGGKRWTPKMVEEDSGMAVYHFKKLVKLAEQIANHKAA